MKKSKLNQRKHWGQFTDGFNLKKELSESELIQPHQKLERLKQLQNKNVEQKSEAT